jgi:hypothetical protein
MAAAGTLTTHDGASYDNIPPAAEVLMDVVQMGSRYSAEGVTSLEELGYSERFFGVAKFLPSTCNLPCVSAKQSCMLCFTRNVTSGRFKRSPRCMAITVSESAKTNLISAKALSHTSQYGKLKVCEERKSKDFKNDPRTQLLLEFRVNFFNAETSSDAAQAWFTVDDSLTTDDDVVIVTTAFATKHGISVSHSASATATSAIAEDKAVIGRTFFDTGAQMSCIAPHLVLPALCINRAKVNVQVMQGVHEAGTSNEAVQLCFDLFDNQMVPTRYREWFLIWDNPYGIILGDSFCEQFTSWKQLLASWTSAETKAKFQTSTTFTTWNHVREPKPAVDQSSSEAATNVKRARVDTSHLRSKHPVSGVELKHRNAGSRPIVSSRDHLNYVPFDGLRPAGLLKESAKRLDQYEQCRMQEKQVKTMLNALPKDLRCSFDMAEMQNRFAKDQRSMCAQIMHDIVALPQGLMMGTGAGGIVRRASLFEPMVHIRYPSSSEGNVTSEIAAQTAAERYLLHRAAAAEWTWFDDDESHYQELLRQEHTPLAAAIKPTPLTSSQKYTVNWLTKCLTEDGKKHVAVWTSEQDGVVRGLDQRDAAAAAKASAALAASKPLQPPNDLPTVHCFQQGNVIKFKDCVRVPEFNGKLGRLY